MGAGYGDGGKEPQPAILFLCDVNVAAGGHVDFKSTNYYYEGKADIATVSLQVITFTALLLLIQLRPIHT